ncbi:hypothetical protein BACCELL_02492 [Bacteroides cellulosilyticus DSM 14838]|uniref:Uncharacterized protein n=1 Tax=Bacteroides cellulosilyticus DSM 14838 TaxID=537012 RepID=E2NDY1_9BACE|nr:hypothetical protein BACCELL_02492 [Bacteroides cellulosilyticus DSM 14838]
MSVINAGVLTTYWNTLLKLNFFSPHEINVITFPASYLFVLLGCKI